ncbi:MAG: tyrosine-protein phosphatase [Candidatus Cloacimonetes bacterium]|nr:tyrosine-protein phosphatase [Candidatus Cloacimonadota bacterium]
MIEIQEQTIIYIPDKEFRKFRNVKAGNISNGVLYRSSSPLKGGDTKKAKEKMAVKAGIKCVINLDDDNSVLRKLSEDVPWYYELVVKKCVIGVPMTISIPGSKLNEKKLKTAIQFMISHEGPYLIHCFAGIDRTGFVIALLEALMGASLKEICKDYLSVFPVDYSDTCRQELYRKMENFIIQLNKITQEETLTDENIQSTTVRYLHENIHLSQVEIEKLKERLSGTKNV